MSATRIDAAFSTHRSSRPRCRVQDLSKATRSAASPLASLSMPPSDLRSEPLVQPHNRLVAIAAPSLSAFSFAEIEASPRQLSLMAWASNGSLIDRAVLASR